MLGRLTRIQQHAAIDTTIKKCIYKSDGETRQNLKIEVLILGFYTLLCSTVHERSFHFLYSFHIISM